MNEQDPRIAEILELAAIEGFRLPMPASMILFFEDRGRVVDLRTGKVSNAIVGTPSASGKAVSHLLRDVVGEVAL